MSARPSPYGLYSIHVSIEPKAERQLRFRVQVLVLNPVRVSAKPDAQRLLRLGARVHLPVHDVQVSIDIKAERQLRPGHVSVESLVCFDGVNQHKSRKAIETPPPLRRT